MKKPNSTSGAGTIPMSAVAKQRIAIVAEKLHSKELFSQKAAEAKRSLASVSSLPL
ncbi:MAG TPA: hypothetical protein VK151_15205 [Fluviicola sp.]|nr:hypothetical protein [Fluviicola sp.]